MRPKKLFSCAMSAVLAVSVLVQNGVGAAFAASDDYVSDCGKTASYTLSSGGVLTISGEGELYNYHSDLNEKIFSYRSSIVKVIIEDGITKIPPYAFADMPNLQEVVMGDDVAYIGHDAFSGCDSLDAIRFGESFASLENVPISGISSITFTDKCSYTGIDGIVYNKDVTELVYVPDKLSDMTDLVIPDTVTKIDKGTLSKLTKLETIRIGAGITDLSEIPYKLPTVQSIIVSPENSVYGSSDGILYTADKSEMLYIPPKYQYTKLIIPDATKKFGDDVKFPINDWTDIHIGASLEYLPNGFPLTRSTIRQFTVSKDNKEYASVDGILYNKLLTTLLAYPYATENTVLTLPDTVESVSDSAVINIQLTELNLGRRFTDTRFVRLFDSSSNTLEKITVTKGNPLFYTVDDVLFNSETSSMVLYPMKKDSTVFTVPDGVAKVACSIPNINWTEVKIGNSFDELKGIPYAKNTVSKISVSSDNKYFTAVGNALYSKDRTELHRVCGLEADEYTLGEEIVSLGQSAFNGCKINKLIVLNPNLIPYGAKTGGIKTIAGYSDSHAQHFVADTSLKFEALDADTAPLIVYPDMVILHSESWYSSSDTTKRLVGNKPNLTFSIKEGSFSDPSRVEVTEDGYVRMLSDYYYDYSDYRDSGIVLVSDGNETVEIPVALESYAWTTEMPCETTSMASIGNIYIDTYTVAVPPSIEANEGDTIDLNYKLKKTGTQKVGSGYSYSSYNDINLGYEDYHATYSTDNTDIISISEDGIATVIGTGVAEITIKYDIHYYLNQNNYYYYDYYYSGERDFFDSFTQKIKIYCEPKQTELALGSFISDVSYITFKPEDISSYYVNENNRNYSTDGIALYNKNMSEIVYVAGVLEGNEYRLPESVRSCANNAFSVSPSLEKLEVPDFLTFSSGCTLPPEVTIYKNYGKIKTSAYADHPELKKVVIEDGITLIDDNAFAGCTNLEAVYVPESVTGIRASAFELSPNVTFYGYRHTYTQSYAEMFGYTFVPLDDLPIETTTTEYATTTEETTTTEAETTTEETTTEEEVTTTEETTTEEEVTTTEVTTTEEERTTTNSTTTGTNTTFTLPHTEEPDTTTEETTTEPEATTTELTTTDTEPTTTETETETETEPPTTEPETTVAEETTTTTEAETTVEITTTSATQIASIYELADMAKKDYKSKTDYYPRSAEAEVTDNGALLISLYNDMGTQIDVYLVDPYTGLGISLITSKGVSLLDPVVPDPEEPAVASSIYELADMAKRDYKSKTGIYPRSSEAFINGTDAVEISLYDDNGDLLDAYLVDPITGIGISTENGAGVELPQTGNNSPIKAAAVGFGSALIAIGAFITIANRKSRRRISE